ncbi:MAG TPA: LCP family protein [Anaerolineales bacterium]|nr:LCP family protein [Anaerolineales bacterium]
MRSSTSPTTRRRSNVPDWVAWALGGALVLGAVLSGYLVFTVVRNLVAAWTGTGPTPFQFSGQSPTTAPGETPLPAVVEATPVPWNGTDRITILVMGLDYRDWEAGVGAPRTDSMMLVTIDPVARTAGMLSIPRDLWVEIPGFEHNRINTAFFLGQSYNLPGGGPALAMKTVENLIGVPVPYFAVIEFSAFERMIDEIGGIDILVPERVKISPLGRRSRWLEAKAYHLDGPNALAYARARKTEGGDFDRAQRQQQVVMAVRDRVLGFEMIPRLVTRAPALYQELQQGIRTNLSFDQMVALGMLVAQIDKSSIQRGVIAPPDMVIFQILPDGAEVLKPVPDRIRELRDEIFTNTGAIGPSLPIEDQDPIEAARQETARLAVRNGSGIEGLATSTSEYLKSQGLNVTEVGNADRLDYEVSRILVHTDRYPYTVRYLAALLHLSESQILNQVVPDSPVDIVVILGRDWQVPH